MTDTERTILEELQKIRATVEATYITQEVLDNDDLLAFLKLKDRVMCATMREQKLPYVKIGKSYRYALEDVLEWIRKRKVIDEEEIQVALIGLKEKRVKKKK